LNSECKLMCFILLSLWEKEWGSSDERLKVLKMRRFALQFQNTTYEPYRYMKNDFSQEQVSLTETDTSAPFIFLAEDDIDDQELLTEAFQHHNENIKVHSVNNGKKAVNYLNGLSQDAMPCLIVLDFNLPEVDGSEILHFLSQESKFVNIPKVVWSTSNSQPYREACLALGATAYFTKPNDISGIDKLAKEMLNFCSL